MALTRKSLKAMGLTDEQADSIIEMHTETMSALKEQRDTSPDAVFPVPLRAVGVLAAFGQGFGAGATGEVCEHREQGLQQEVERRYFRLVFLVRGGGAGGFAKVRHGVGVVWRHGAVKRAPKAANALVGQNALAFKKWRTAHHRAVYVLKGAHGYARVDDVAHGGLIRHEYAA